MLGHYFKNRTAREAPPPAVEFYSASTGYDALRNKIKFGYPPFIQKNGEYDGRRPLGDIAALWSGRRELLGLATLNISRDPPVIRIDHFQIAASYRHQGHSKILLKAIFDQASLLGTESLKSPRVSVLTFTSMGEAYLEKSLYSQSAQTRVQYWGRSL